jgi:hypothetical protein
MSNKELSDPTDCEIKNTNALIRIINALEKNAVSGQRIAKSLDILAGLLTRTIEVVEPDTPGGVTRCTLRTYTASPLSLYDRQDSDDDD